MKRKVILVFLVLVIISLAACVDSGSAAAKTVETYLQALAAQEGETVSNFACGEWESQAIMEMDSFQAVNPQLVDLACEQTDKDGETSLVVCQGKLVASYNDEQQEFDLNLRTYEVVEEGGEMRVCGYR